MAKNLVIVESPTKARTIRNYLPSGYQVEASMGHVRDLPPSAKEIPPAYKDKKWATLGINIDDKFQKIDSTCYPPKDIFLTYSGSFISLV